MRAPIAWLWIGVFLAFSAAFMVAPAAMLAVQAFSDDDGFTLQYFAELGQYRYVTAFQNSLLLSFASASVGVVAGGLIAYALQKPGTGKARAAVTSFAAVAANFAGVPLAFSFIATVGTLGLLTTMLKSIGIDLYGMGFSLFSISGLTLVYAYFQIPLMVIVFSPALEGMRPAWREAAATMGATSRQYWRLVGLPVLAPSLLASWILLFGNAFSAYATAYALTSGNIILVTTEISAVLSGNVSNEPQVGAALSLGMIVVMVLVLVASQVVGSRAARWTAKR